MNTIGMMRNGVQYVRTTLRDSYITTCNIRIGLATGTVSLILPGVASAQTDSGSGANFGVGGMLELGAQAVKATTALVGVGVIGYLVYRATLGRKRG